MTARNQRAFPAKRQLINRKNGNEQNLVCLLEYFYERV